MKSRKAVHRCLWWTLLFSGLLFLSSPGYSQTDRVYELTRKLKDNDWRIRAEGAQALYDIKDVRAVEPLIATLKDENRHVRKYAAQALGVIKDGRAVEPLIAALKDENDGVRSEAAAALGEIKDTNAVEPLIAALKDSDFDVRMSVINALGDIKDARAIAPLIALMKDKYRFQYPPRALSRIGEPAIEPLITALLKDGDPYVRMGAAMALGYINDIRVIDLLLTALSKEKDSNVKYEVALALGAKGAIAVDALIAALKSQDASARQGAVKGLGLTKDFRAIEPLIETLLKDRDHNVRQEAAIALGDIKDVRAVEPLIEALKDNEGYMRHHVEEALLKIGEPAVNPLITALHRINIEVKTSLVFLLDRIGTDQAKNALHLCMEGMDLEGISENYASFFRKGTAGTEWPLVLALLKYGNTKMAEDFLNCGNPALSNAGSTWARMNGYRILPSPSRNDGER
jgi:HEAT repeat protein